MRKFTIKSRKLLFSVSNLEKKHKIITYASLLFLTVSTYFLRTENQNVKIEYATIKEKNLGLKQNMVIFNRNYENFPLPVWQKVKRGNRFIIQYVNPEFVNKMGHSFEYDAYAPIGKDNFEIYSKKYAQDYHDKDLAVAITGKELNSKDEILNAKGKITYVKVVKWRQINNQNDTLVYGMIKEFINN